MATKNETTALTEQNTGGFLATNNALSELAASELAGLDMTFDRIKIPAGGGTMFEMPGEDDEPEMVKEFSAAIVDQHVAFAYYKTAYKGGNAPPDCYSFDGKTGEGSPGGDCQSCPLNQFGSADEGNGKACKNRRQIYLLREGEIFPMRLSLPVGSLKEFSRYIKKLLSKGLLTSNVVTRFSLKKATSQGGVVYSQAQFALDRVLTPEEQTFINQISEQVKAFSRQPVFDTDIAVDPETGEVLDR